LEQTSAHNHFARHASVTLRLWPVVNMSETPSPSAPAEAAGLSLLRNEEVVVLWTEAEKILPTLRAALADPSCDYSELFAAISVAAHALTDATAAALAMRRQGVVVCVGRSGECAPDLGMRLSVDSGISGECLRTGKMLRCDDTQKDYRADPAICLRLKVASIAAVPLHHDGRVVGILEAFSDRTYAFAEEHMKALQDLAQLAEDAYRKELGITEEVPDPTPAPIAAVVAGPRLLSRVPKLLSRVGISAKALTTSLPKRTWTYVGAGGAVAALVMISLLALRNAKPVTSANTESPNQAPPSSDAPIGGALTWSAKNNSTKQTRSRGDVQQAAKLDRDAPQRSAPPAATPRERPENLAQPEPRPVSSESEPPTLIASNSDHSSPLVNVLSSTPELPRFTTPVSQGVTPGVVTHRVQPIYPSQAIPMRLGGAVVLDATVTEDGRVRDLNVVRGNGLLAQAAIIAVSQWRYKPYLLNGKPVAMKTQITVDFKAP
jgi:TonB family protein